MANSRLMIGCNECEWIGSAAKHRRCGYCGHVNVSPVDPDDDYDFMSVVVEGAVFTVKMGCKPNTILVSEDRYQALRKANTVERAEGRPETINGWRVVICDVPNPRGFAVCYLLTPEDFPTE